MGVSFIHVGPERVWEVYTVLGKERGGLVLGLSAMPMSGPCWPL